MQYYVEVEYFDDMGRFTTALLKRRGVSQEDVLNKVWEDFFAIAREDITNGGIMQPEDITVTDSAIQYPEYCYGEITGRKRIKGTIRTLARNDGGAFSESEYRLNIHQGTGTGAVTITDWKYWG